jgi:dsRNA-specific ribonuclease
MTLFLAQGIGSGIICSNERLEFLGDAVLGFCAIRDAFEMEPKLPPGELSNVKMAAVNNERYIRKYTYIKSYEVICIPNILQL